MIKHKNPSVLRFIRQNLGFGRILNCSLRPPGNGPSESKAILLRKQKSPGVSGGGARPPKHLYRFIVADRISIPRLTHLYNGNLILKKSNRAFAK